MALLANWRICFNLVENDLFLGEHSYFSNLAIVTEITFETSSGFVLIRIQNFQVKLPQNQTTCFEGID